MDQRELNVQRAKFAEQTERYDDMRDAMKSVVEAGSPLTSEERNLMSVAYKNVCGARRSAWRIANSLLHNAQQNASHEVMTKAGEEMKTKIEEELDEICCEVLGLIEKCLDQSDESEHKTFFNKMRGDYYRYRVEVAKPDSATRAELVGQAKEAYKGAMEAAEKLPSTHPIRLGLALNFSVFYFEIEMDHEQACHLAKSAFDGAIAELDSLKEDSYKDSTLIMQLLRDNLTLWSADTQEETEDE